MTYHFNTDQDQKEMLQAIGATSIEELFESIPAELRFNRDLNIPPAMGELELTQSLAQMAEANSSASTKPCFLGAGSYDHFIPAVVDSIASRGEFYTSYTPYQPEVSQGNLQVMFEYQTLICQLTGMDVSNASLYDGGSSVAEAVLMCMNISRKTGKVVVANTVHPEYRDVLKTYLKGQGSQLTTVEAVDGLITADQLVQAIDNDTACVVVQYPNFFGCIEDLQEITDKAHEKGAFVVAAVDPISLGMLKRPGDLGVDVVVAEGQSLGSPMSFGGPYLGILACREKFVRRMPGRLAGQTEDRRGRRCWVLTLQTREQHIRRDKATSNICTNQGLFALRASIYLSLLGPSGIRQVANLCLQKSHYAAKKISENPRLELAWSHPFLKEFVVRDLGSDVHQLLEDAESKGYLAGVPLGRWYPELSDCFMVATTEQRTRQQIDGLAGSFSNTLAVETLNHA